jgi:hypothetical protein
MFIAIHMQSKSARTSETKDKGTAFATVFFLGKISLA